MFMCARHWYKLRKDMRDAIWKEYRRGQERDKVVTIRYLVVQQRAIGEVAFRPNNGAAAQAAAPYLLKSELLRRTCIDAGDGDPLEGLAEPCKA